MITILGNHVENFKKKVPKKWSLFIFLKIMICCILRINQKRFLSSFRYRIFNYLRLILNSDSVVKYSFNLYINFACYLTDIQAPSISLLSSLLPTIYTSNMHDSPPLRVHNYDAIEKEMQNI